MKVKFKLSLNNAFYNFKESLSKKKKIYLYKKLKIYLKLRHKKYLI